MVGATGNLEKSSNETPDLGCSVIARRTKDD